MTLVYPTVANKGFCATPHPVLSMATAVVSVQNWMHGAAQRVPQSLVGANQMTSLNAMVSYIAARSGQSEFRVERSLSDHFSIPNAKCLPADQFDNAIRYLVDVCSVVERA